jgi:hypothetical protein
MTPATVVTSTEGYQVKDGSRLTLEIIVGDGQAGGTSILWQGDIVDFPPSSFPFEIAEDGATARARTLHCTTRVRDVNPNTNRTSVTYKLRGGKNDKDFHFSTNVPKPDDFATYVVDFIFI